MVEIEEVPFSILPIVEVAIHTLQEEESCSAIQQLFAKLPAANLNLRPLTSVDPKTAKALCDNFCEAVR